MSHRVRRRIPGAIRSEQDAFRPEGADDPFDPLDRDGEDAHLLILPPAKVEAILAAYQEINPAAGSLLGCLVTFNMPFTLVKGLLTTALCFLVYKPLSPILHGNRF